MAEQETEFTQLFKQIHGVENEEHNEKKTLGNTAKIKFIGLNKDAEGKIDSGATTSSLHAVNIKIANGKVHFNSPILSNNVISMDIVGQQDVHTSDNKEGSEVRPIVKFDIEIDGHPMKDVMFNLNDRTHMDTPILIGQNVLRDGDFVIDVKKNEPQAEETEQSAAKDKTTREQAVLNALNVLIENDVSMKEILEALSRKTLREISV